MEMKQIYEDYTAEDFKVWQLLYDRQMGLLPDLADSAYLEGLEKIDFTANKIPDFDKLNAKLSAITGWQVTAVPGLIDNKPFFELLKDQIFPAATWFRKLKELEYLEEPDMFHDVFGHVPLLTNADFCGFLSGLSRVALRFIDNPEAIELIARLYWYTVEFGLIQEQGKPLRIYGAGILSSSGESVYSIKSEKPKRYKFDVEHIISFPYIKDRYQEQYFIINSYKELYDAVPKIEHVLEAQVLKVVS